MSGNGVEVLPNCLMLDLGFTLEIYLIFNEKHMNFM